MKLIILPLVYKDGKWGEYVYREFAFTKEQIQKLRVVDVLCLMGTEELSERTYKKIQTW